LGNLAKTSNGGGIHVTEQSVITLTNSTISNNSATGENASSGENSYGGGIYVSGASRVEINDSTISGNYANFGGGFNSSSGVIALNGTTVSGNSARQGGSAAVSSTSLTLSNSTISGNSANFAAGIQSFLSWLDIRNSSISGNAATSSIGGISARYGSVELRNTILAGNISTSGAREMAMYSVVSLGIEGNVIGDAGESLQNAFRAYQQLGGYAPVSATNITATYDGNRPTELNRILLPLAENGGPTQTHALVEGSPAINAGDNTICQASPISGLDQRGETRPPNSCDIGAFEGALEFIGADDPSLFVVPLPNGKTVIFGL